METPKFDEFAAVMTDKMAKGMSNGEEQICKDYKKFSEAGGKAALLAKLESQASKDLDFIQGLPPEMRREALSKTHTIMYNAIDLSTGNSHDIKQSMRNLTDQFVLSISDDELTDDDIQSTLGVYMKDAEEICGI